MSDAVNWTQRTLGQPAMAMEIGNGIVDSWLKPMDWQVDQLAGQLAKLATTDLILIGFSQGGLLARGYVQRYAGRTGYPTVRNLLTFGTPHGGIYNALDYRQVYSNETQAKNSWAGYWKDPYNLDTYQTKCRFLPELNGDRTPYARLPASLEHLVMVSSESETVVSPADSSKFSYYRDNTLELVPLRESIQYLEDRTGLRSLDQRKGLHWFNSPCYHEDLKTYLCLDYVKDLILPFLR
jgi:palmitoyl-protein thioesterase